MLLAGADAGTVVGDVSRLLRHGSGNHLPLRPAGLIVVFNNNGVYKGTDVNRTRRRRRSGTTVFVKGARYDKMMEAFGGVGVNATTPEELTRPLTRPSLRASRP